MMALLLMSGSSTRPSSSMPEFPRYYCLVPTKSCFLIIMLTSTIRYCKALAATLLLFALYPGKTLSLASFRRITEGCRRCRG